MGARIRAGAASSCCKRVFMPEARLRHDTTRNDTGMTFEEETMAVTIFVVRATITKDREAAFNKWYNEEHAPQVLQFNGAASARRYKKVLGEDKFQYMAVYEFASEAAFKRFQESDHLKTLIKDYNANFGETSERERSAYVQIWP
jgi:antibiotic biosynthesis monooxygenase (ABM) superfamily enzyme